MATETYYTKIPGTTSGYTSGTQSVPDYAMSYGDRISSNATGLTWGEKEDMRQPTERLQLGGDTGRSGGSGRASNPGSYITGYETQEYGRSDYEAALVDWNRVYADAQQGIPAALELIAQFAPGGGYGTGRRAEAKELIQQGVARDTASAVGAGMSSMTGSRGLNVLAGSQLATQYANIEDMRAQLQLAAFQPYTQMLTNLAQVGVARPTYKQYVSQVTTPQYETYGASTKPSQWPS